MLRPRTPVDGGRRSLRALVLLAAVLLPLLPAAGAGASEQVATSAGPSAGATPAPGSQEAVERARELRQAAQKQVAAFQAQVDAATAVLVEGSQRLAEKQAELARTQARQVQAEADADAALARAAEAKQQLHTIVAAAYRSPVPDAMQLALTTGPDGIRDAVVARADLDRVRGSSQDLLREATAARVQAADLVRTAEQLTEKAATQEREVAADVERLKALALQSEATLQRAADALSLARATEAVALDDAAARAAAEASAAAALAAAREAAARNAGVLALCTGADYRGQSNGFLDPATLCPLDDAPGHALRPDAAAAFNALNAEHKARRGTPLCVSDSYRSYAGQVDVYARKPGLAAVPGTSNHGWGLAVDLGCGVERFGSEAHVWMRQNAVRFGWFHPGWAQQGGSKPEAWHWEFAGVKG
jgi:hypothetical protein